MPINVPDNPRVYTTTYDNFKGVDFTNDPTNVWRRRSPTGVNMLPDESGRPFKRHGWDILISNAELCAELGVESCQILKCSYFELAGVDHIVVFTNCGVLFYANEQVTATNTDRECYLGYDRSFFFEGNGMSAFYIYGGFRVWRYSYDNGFVFEEVTDKITVPTVMISAEADGTGTVYEGYNLLGTKASFEYNNTNLFAYWGTDNYSFSVDRETFTTAHPKNYSVTYIYDATAETWKDSGGSAVVFPLDGITPMSQPENGTKMFVVHANGVLLPNNVSPSQRDDVVVLGTKSKQFDYPMQVLATGSVSVGSCLIHPDTITDKRERQQAWIEFDVSETFNSVDGEDCVKVIFPSVKIITTQLSGVTETGNATLVGL